MFGLGFTEVLVLLVLILIIVGPSRFPDIARGIGKGVREIRRTTRDLDSVPEIRELRRAVNDIRGPVNETLREPVLDPDIPAPISPPATEARAAPPDAAAPEDPDAKS